jgi:hypothetical protein
MTPKEKAEELIKMFNKVKIFLDIEPCSIETDLEDVDCDANKQCALIAVNEILSMGIMSDSGDWRMAKFYWEEVKQEIEKI